MSESAVPVAEHERNGSIRDPASPRRRGRDPIRPVILGIITEGYHG
ncbi:hypothetical protein KM295_02685 [Natronomonas sp. F2-12]|uniref:Uncharacterized protein n=1 Tax=Natronomonas aquatica TaxID=2841590 RepID=A0A9R1CRL8_9EURY|nr:hypothetical protein [Natronomonas aquatica]MCQ4332409.1 hypothetical protein [Natronomonas aquatica]